MLLYFINNTSTGIRKVVGRVYVEFMHSLPESQWVPLKARSHGAIFVNATAIRKMGCVDVNDAAHMVQLRYHSHTCVCDVARGMGFIAILCNCNVRFQYT